MGHVCAWNKALLLVLWIFFPKQNLKCCQIFVVFFTQKMKKNGLCNKSKNASVRFFMCMSSMCVQLFTAVEAAVLKLYVPPNLIWPLFPWKRTAGIFFWFCLHIFSYSDEKGAKQFLDQHPPPPSFFGDASVAPLWMGKLGDCSTTAIRRL